MKRAIAILPFALLLAVSACEGPQRPLGRDFGDATGANFARQVVNPEPVYAGYGAPDMDGTKAADAIKRYKGGTVTAPEAISTTSGVSSGN